MRIGHPEWTTFFPTLLNLPIMMVVNDGRKYTPVGRLKNDRIWPVNTALLVTSNLAPCDNICVLGSQWINFKERERTGVVETI
jgi:hypothetical protein